MSIKYQHTHTFCHKCGSRDKLSRHHIVPRREQGGDHCANIAFLCRPCHDLYNLLEAQHLKRHGSIDYVAFFDAWAGGDKLCLPLLSRLWNKNVWDFNFGNDVLNGNWPWWDWVVF